MTDNSQPTAARRRYGRLADLALEIDDEFASLCPPPAPDELAQLRRSISAEGCLDELVAWEGTNKVLDGHNRHRICAELDLPLSVVFREFPDRESAGQWILNHQLGRRLLPMELNLLAEKLFDRLGAASLAACRPSTREPLTPDSLLMPNA